MSEKNHDKARHFYEQMLLIRVFEEKCAEMYSAMKIRGFLHLYIGEEAIAVGVMEPMLPDDAVVATYREHGHALAKGLDPGGVMAEMYGKVEGVSRGRGGSMHLFSEKHRFYGGNAIVGGGLPLAVGLGLADKMQGNRRVTVCFFGEGAAAEGEFHESMNLAAMWKLPVLFCCENNLYAMGTALDRSESQPDIHLKAASYGMTSQQVDGMDVDAVNEAATDAIRHIKDGEGPHFIEFKTYRFRAHSMFDPELYREKSEVEGWKERDPLRLFRERALEDGRLSQDDIDEIEASVEDRVQQAVEFAESGTLEPVEDLEKFVYSEEGGQ
jgi:pyruvate dehydrogenase E1 component alpha subunit